MIINITKCGQLGNRLQLFAHLIAFAIEHDVRIINLGFLNYSEYFESTANDMFCRFPQRKSAIQIESFREPLFKIAGAAVKRGYLESAFSSKCQVVRTKPFSDFDGEYRLDSDEFVDLSRRKHLFMHGYYFVDYFAQLKHAEAIRSHFKPITQHCENVSRVIEGARANCDLLIGVHIRRGDYATYQGGKYFYGTELFLKKMQQMQSLFPGSSVRFLICSDETPDPAEFGNLDVCFSTEHLIEDMYALAECDYIIGTPSTFSRWSCFYGNVPTYQIADPTADMTLDSFVTYDEIVHIHMQQSPSFS